VEVCEGGSIDLKVSILRASRNAVCVCVCRETLVQGYTCGSLNTHTVMRMCSGEAEVWRAENDIEETDRQACVQIPYQAWYIHTKIHLMKLGALFSIHTERAVVLKYFFTTEVRQFGICILIIQETKCESHARSHTYVWL
jgi:hypothetical protein